MSLANSSKLSAVHPELATRVKLIADKLTFPISVVQGMRTFAEQDALFAQGRSKPGKRVTNARGGYSMHNYGLAVDLAPLVGSKIDWNDLDKFHEIGDVAKSVGLEWGGDWHSFPDEPHVQMPGWTLTSKNNQPLAFKNRGGLDAVWAEASKRIKPVDQAEPTGDVVASSMANSFDSTTPAQPPTQTPVEVTTDQATGEQTESSPANEIVVPAPQAVDAGSQKSFWATIVAIPGLIFAYITQNIGEAIGWLKDRELLKWFLIVGGIIFAIYLIRQIVMSVVKQVGAIWLTHQSMKYHADPNSNNVSVAQPAPAKEVTQ